MFAIRYLTLGGLRSSLNLANLTGSELFAVRYLTPGVKSLTKSFQMEARLTICAQNRGFQKAELWFHGFIIMLAMSS